MAKSLVQIWSCGSGESGAVGGLKRGGGRERSNIPTAALNLSKLRGSKKQKK